MIEGGDLISDTMDEAGERSLEDDLRDLAGHARDYARAEFAFQKARLAFAGKSAAWITAWVVAALVLLFFALMALILGAIVTLAPLITALGATLAVFGFLLVLAAICGLGALRKWRALTRLIDGDPAP